MCLSHSKPSVGYLNVHRPTTHSSKRLIYRTIDLLARRNLGSAHNNILITFIAQQNNTALQHLPPDRPEA